jgi:16S rRNA (guanine527-N7)-methyltransferase
VTPDPLAAVRDYASARGLAPDWGALLAYFEGLYRANEVQNLTRVAPEDFALRHVLDSLLVAEAVEPAGAWLDVGTGPGLPAWPLAWAYPSLRVVAMDSSGKPLAFLREHPLPNLEVVQARAEDSAEERFDVVTGRAVAPLAVQAEVSLPWVAVGGAFVPFRTPADEAAARDFPAGLLGAGLEALERRELPGGGAVRLFPVYRKLRKAPRRKRRSWAEIRRAPLV